MNKLDMKINDITEENIGKIAKLFPTVITEKEDENGEIKKAIDFNLLKQELSKEIVDDENERYRLDWPGKKASILKANTPINKTLRPCKEESVNFNKTENVYIEGDNFEVLKILQESYLGRVKMIYIDPPYNTGKDFVYRDNTTQSKEEYEEELGVMDEDGGKLFKNTDTNGRFHSDWLSMMYERLTVARDLLKDDGVMFISIDQDEIHNLRKICDEIFGENNFLCTLHWKKKKQPSFLARVANVVEYILVYTNNISKIKKLSIEKIKDSDKPIVNAGNNMVSLTFPAGIRVKAKINKIIAGKIKNKTIEIVYENDVVIKDGRTISEMKIAAPFRNNQSTLDLLIKEDLIFVTSNLGLRRDVSEKERNSDKSITDLLLDWGQNQDSDSEFRKLFEHKFFDNPKPVKYIKNIVKSVMDKNALVLDFFSGSATTAHAVMQLNAEDGGNRKFIMTQLAEKTDEKSEAFKAGYKTISEIGMERIRRAGKKILEENNDKLKERETPLDIGFRVYKTDTTNMKDVYYNPSELEQSNLLDVINNVKEDRNAEDLLAQVILDRGLTLDLEIEQKEIKNHKVFFVASNSLVACFDNNINFEIVDEIAKCEPLKVVFKDSCFKDDKDRINVENRFKRLSPETVISVL